MLAGGIGIAVLPGEQIHKAAGIFDTYFEPDFAWDRTEVVHDQYGIVSPVIANRQYFGRPCLQDGKLAPADLRRFLTHTDHALHPVHKGIGIASLLRDVDMFEIVRPSADHWQDRLLTLGKSALWFSGPLHWSASAITLGKAKIISHADLVPVAQHRCAGQRHHHAVGKLQAAAIALQHGSETPANAASVELHVVVRSKGRTHSLPLRVSEPAQIEFIVIAQELSPLRR